MDFGDNDVALMPIFPASVYSKIRKIVGVENNQAWIATQVDLDEIVSNYESARQQEAEADPPRTQRRRWAAASQSLRETANDISCLGRHLLLNVEKLSHEEASEKIGWLLGSKPNKSIER